MIVHHEQGSWWAESDDLPGFSALADNLDALRKLSKEGVEELLAGEAFRLVERDEFGSALDTSPFASAPDSWWTLSGGSGSAFADGARNFAVSSSRAA
jgi:predicted RNase H-like HicB family nuclease